MKTMAAPMLSLLPPSCELKGDNKGLFQSRPLRNALFHLRVRPPIGPFFYKSILPFRAFFPEHWYGRFLPPSLHANLRKSACNTMMQANPSTRQQASPSDTVVLITGVSRGLGRALALELAQRGYTVVGCGRNEERLLELEKSLIGGSRHLLKKVDVACDSSVKEFAQTVMETKGAPAIVINFAGIINRNGKLWELSAAEFDAVVDVNIKGAANVMRHFLPLMKQGILVNITSGWGRIGAADVAPYCASKWAIEGLTQAVAKEVPQGVTVVALNPGVVNTDMLVSCFGAQASLYQAPDTWAPLAADAILNLTAGDNGASLNV